MERSEEIFDGLMDWIAREIGEYKEALEMMDEFGYMENYEFYMGMRVAFYRVFWKLWKMRMEWKKEE